MRIEGNRIMPRLGNRNIILPKRNFISLICNGLNKLISYRKTLFWQITLHYLYKTVDGRNGSENK